MEEFAKVEKLVEITGASYEDARNALRACDGDMVDSMVYLEKLGKVTKSGSTYTDPRFAPISEAEVAAAAIRNEERERAAAVKKTSGGIGGFIGKILRFLLCNKIAISKDKREIIRLPLIALILLCGVSFGTAVVAIIISMFCGIEYRLVKDAGVPAAY